MDTKYAVDTKIANSKRELALKQASYDEEVNARVRERRKLWGGWRGEEGAVVEKAEAELAYQLQAAKLGQAIRTEEVAIEVVARRKAIAVQAAEATRREKELISTVRLPAEAEAFKVNTESQGQRTAVIERAKGSLPSAHIALGLASHIALSIRREGGVRPGDGRGGGVRDRGHRGSGGGGDAAQGGRLRPVRRRRRRPVRPRGPQLPLPSCPIP